MSNFKTKENVDIYYKDWGRGQPVVLSHGWPLSADAWDGQMLALLSKGYRVIAHDRRGHGRSSQTFENNTMDQYADDLAQLIDHLDLKDAILVGHSTGGGEVTRYVARHSTSRVSKVVLLGSVTPLMLKTPENPDGVPMAVFDDIRKNTLANRAQFFKQLTLPFYGYNRNSAEVSEELREHFWLQGMMGGIKAHYDSIKQFSESDFTKDLNKLDVPTLIIHGDEDQIVPFGNSAAKTVKLVPHAELLVYEGADHGLAQTHQERFNADLLEFIATGTVCKVEQEQEGGERTNRRVQNDYSISK